jgi:hypothetical protein
MHERGSRIGDSYGSRASAIVGQSNPSTDKVNKDIAFSEENGWNVLVEDVAAQ